MNVLNQAISLKFESSIFRYIERDLNIRESQPERRIYLYTHTHTSTKTMNRAKINS